MISATGGMRMNDDINGDEAFTISDIGPWLIDVLLMPGDGLVSLLVTYTPGIAAFFELDASSRGGVFSIWSSILLWLAALVIIGTAINFVREFDRRATSWIGGRYADGLRWCRVLRRRIVTTLARSRRTANDVMVESISLPKPETVVLRCLAGLEDGAVMTVDDLATRLNCPKRVARTVVARLSELGFIERGTDTLTRSPGHRIATAGQMYLLGA
jgi:DNA-binding MarR family transcriptional regulator